MTTELNSPQDPDKTVQDHPQVSSRRRRILKLAMTSAPFAITLPNGSALANISAFWCVNKNRHETPYLAIIKKELAADRWERVKVDQHKFEKEIKVTDKDGNPVLDANGQHHKEVIIKKRFLIEGRFWDFANHSLSEDKNVADFQDKGPTGMSVYVLAYWQPVKGDTDVDIPHVGIYPTFAQFDGNITPLDGSCFCSVNPQAAGPVARCT